MAHRPLLGPQTVLNNVAVTSSGDTYSQYSNVNQTSIWSYTVVWSGTPTGTVTIEVSNDYVPAQPNNTSIAFAGTWVALTLSAAVAPAGGAGSAFIDIDTCGAAWVRLHYAASGGSGNITATIAGKAS